MTYRRIGPSHAAPEINASDGTGGTLYFAYDEAGHLVGKYGSGLLHRERIVKPCARARRHLSEERLFGCNAGSGGGR
jgi:hypothetical protein